MKHNISSELVRKRLVDLNLTQEEFAKCVGLTKRGIETVLKNGSTSLATMHKIAEILKINLHDLRSAAPSQIVYPIDSDDGSKSQASIALQPIREPISQFHCGQWVQPSFFVGREQELSVASNFVRNRQNLLIVGQPRVGKTSFCHKLAFDLTMEKSSGTLAIVTNVETIVKVSIQSFMSSTLILIIGEMARIAFNLRYTDLLVNRSSMQKNQDTEFVRLASINQFLSQNKRADSLSVSQFVEIIGELSSIAMNRGFSNLVIFYDEANKLRRELSPEILEGIMETMNQTGLTGVYVADPEMYDSLKSSQVFSRHIDVGPYREHVDMLRLVARYYFGDPTKWESVPIEPDARELLWNLTSGIPYRIQLVADFVFSHAFHENARTVETRHVINAVSQAKASRPEAFNC